MISRTDIDDMTDAQDEARAIAEAAQADVTGRANNMPLSDMARAEGFRTLARCIRDPSQPRKMGLSDLAGVLAWEERRIAALADCQFADLARPSQAGDARVARLVKAAKRVAWVFPCLNQTETDAMVELEAALAAMDTPKGGGDE